MKLVPATELHLKKMMHWFSNEEQLKNWSGPNFRYPFDLQSFTEDVKFKSLASFSLCESNTELLAFGQYYERKGKCHLGRLVVNPAHRGSGIASTLMQQLCHQGLNELELKSCSLFVMKHNMSAIKAYEKYGFVFSDYPDELPLDNCLYMIK